LVVREHDSAGGEGGGNHVQLRFDGEAYGRYPVEGYGRFSVSRIESQRAVNLKKKCTIRATTRITVRQHAAVNQDQ
jgi:hypothetical protein